MARDYKPELIASRYVGVARCERYTKNTTLCVIGARYGFKGWWYSRGRKQKLPLVTSDKNGEAARTPKQALANAKAFLARIHGKNN